MITIEHLQKARQLISDPKNWNHRWLKAPKGDGGGGSTYCVLGAILEVQGTRPSLQGIELQDVASFIGLFGKKHWDTLKTGNSPLTHQGALAILDQAMARLRGDKTGWQKAKARAEAMMEEATKVCRMFLTIL